MSEIGPGYTTPRTPAYRRLPWLPAGPLATPASSATGSHVQQAGPAGLSGVPVKFGSMIEENLPPVDDAVLKAAPAPAGPRAPELAAAAALAIALTVVIHLLRRHPVKA